MVQQTVLPFKLKRAPEKITARSGLVIFVEFMKALKLDRLISKYMPKAGSEAGIYAINYIKPLSMMLYGGGESIEDVREIREDTPLREVIGLKQVPSASATGDWLKRMGVKGGIAGKLIKHSRRLILKLATSMEKYRIYLQMRRCTYTLSLE